MTVPAPRILAGALIVSGLVAAGIGAGFARAEESPRAPTPANYFDDDDDDEGGHPGFWAMRHRGDDDGPRAMRNPRSMCLLFTHGRAAALGWIESRLQLTPEQEPAWAAVEAAVKGETEKTLAFCGTLPESLKDATFPAKLEAASGMAQLLADGLGVAKAPVAALYAVLSEEQRKVLDEMGPPHRRDD
jgi:hypothetical protein